MLTQTCQATGRTLLKFSPTKKDIVKKVIECFEEGEADAVRYENSEKIKELRFDRGKEFLNNTMESYCKQKHTLINPTVGYNPESNGISERCNRSILEGADALRIEAGLAKEFLEFAADAYNYLRNHSPIKTLQSKTPWEEWFGKKPSAKRYKIWGCPAYVHIPKESRKKLDRKAWKGIFIGYSPRNLGIYRIWNPSSCKVHEAKFVIFDELHSKVPYDVILAQHKEELEEPCKNEGFKIDSPTINNDSDDGESTISLEDHPRITSLNRQSCQQPITNYYENKNGNDHSDYQTQENISTSDLSSIQNLEHRSTPNNLPESLETSVPESRLALEEPLQLENLTITQIKQAQIAHRKA
ncbi:hypothetical protein K3495_g12829 [Podosphaera aphanis]|nr:hypothetical protein K3495_g12829 [Podosphaera aphanis]